MEDILYQEALLKPKLDKSLERLFNKYEPIMTFHHPQSQDELLKLVKQAVDENLDLLVEHEYCGYLVVVWRRQQND